MPLDGGRVVRAFAWARTRRPGPGRYRTTARVGRMVGWTILGVGVALVLADLVTEGLIGIALGWLLTTGARTGDRRLALERLLRGSPVSRGAMRVDVPFVGPEPDDRHVRQPLRGRRTPWPRCRWWTTTRSWACIGRKRLVRLGRRRFGGTRVEDVMAAPPQAPVLAPSTRCGTRSRR